METTETTTPPMEPEAPQPAAPVIEPRPTWVERVVDIIYFVTAIVELLLGMNLFLRLFNGNPFNPFVSAIYSATQPLVYPFMDMFQHPLRFERPIGLFPDTLVAMLVYLLIAWAFASVVRWVGKRS
jgi:hypothetical protein